MVPRSPADSSCAFYCFEEWDFGANLSTVIHWSCDSGCWALIRSIYAVINNGALHWITHTYFLWDWNALSLSIIIHLLSVSIEVFVFSFMLRPKLYSCVLFPLRIVFMQKCPWKQIVGNAIIYFCALTITRFMQWFRDVLHEETFNHRILISSFI